MLPLFPVEAAPLQCSENLPQASLEGRGKNYPYGGALPLSKDNDQAIELLKTLAHASRLCSFLHP